LKLVALTAIVLVAFAANSVFARLALGPGAADAFGYTGIRLLSGAAMLLILTRWQRGASASLKLGGNLRGAAGLFGYAILFSLAYLMLNTGTGALILFASVQFGLLGYAILKGDRPSLFEWLGIAVAIASLVYLVLPGLVAPDPLGALLMVGAGLSWSFFTIEGRGSRAPLTDTAGNFIRLAPISLILVIAGVVIDSPSAVGVLWAVASGAIASGLGYALWYYVLPKLAPSTPAFIQLTVPVIAAAGGVVFLMEPVTERLVLASVGILGGVALALYAAERRKRRT
jgi:drug/metabolite transporter (DMT)-like permease